MLENELSGNFNQNDSYGVVSMNILGLRVDKSTSESPIKHSKEELECRQVPTGEDKAHDRNV